VARARAYCSTKRIGRRGASVLLRSRRHMHHTVGMQDAFAYVLFAVVGLGILAALIGFAMTNRA
jgi:hypothetical protein